MATKRKSKSAASETEPVQDEIVLKETEVETEAAEAKATELEEAAEAVEPEPVEEAAGEDAAALDAEGEEETEYEEADEEEADADEADEDEADEVEAESFGEVKLERLQKILAKAGVASRRSAEEMIEQGRVQINGQVVTTLGTKADPARDHIRVDGKLLHGAERPRYFILNKPKGYVTTVSDPEGRPTVMEFFRQYKERLYPVGRLDYLSEGLLLMTNDGELAHLLTRAASGVEKTYLVKVSGQPSEEELDRLREGVAIHKGKPGEGRVRTAPAQIRQVRQGDNPWFEVVLTEGRNRELRKMFEEIDHFVEKIRRVGYGPLVLDLEPAKSRELTADEIDELREVALGKKKPASAREKRQRKAIEEMALPTVRPRPTRPAANFDRRGASGGYRPSDRRPQPSFGSRPDARRDEAFDRPRSPRPMPEGEQQEGFRPRAPRPAFGGKPAGRGFGDRARSGAGRPGAYGDAKPRFERSEGAGRGERPARREWSSDRPAPRSTGRPGSYGDAKPRFERSEGAGRGERPARREWSSDRPAPRSTGRPGSYGDAKPRFERSEGAGRGERPARREWSSDRPAPRSTGRPGSYGGAKPRFERSEGAGGGERPARREWSSDRPAPRSTGRPGSYGGAKPRFERSEGAGGGERPARREWGADRPSAPRSNGGSFGNKPRSEGFSAGKAKFARPSRPGGAPARGQGQGGRPAKPFAGRPKTGGAKFRPKSGGGFKKRG
jgi:23S rRNA pseudouridine2605 synthase